MAMTLGYWDIRGVSKGLLLGMGMGVVVGNTTRKFLCSRMGLVKGKS